MKSLIIVFIACISLMCHAQNISQYPNKSVTIIVPYAAGGGNDTVARIVGRKLNELWNIPVVVENKPGADAMIGSNYVARASADGHTLLAVPLSQLVSAGVVLNSHSREVVSWQRELALVGSVGYLSPFILVVSSKSNLKSIRDLADAGRARSITYGILGEGSPYHSYGVLMLDAIKTRGIPVPYKSSPQAVLDLLNGSIDMMVCPEALVLQHITAGNIKALAVIGNTASLELPEVPTTLSIGYNFPNSRPVYNMFAPIGTSLYIQRKLNEDITRAVKMAWPELTQRKMIDPSISIPTNTNEFITAHSEIWIKITERAMKTN